MLVTCGGQHGLLLALMALTHPGDAVLAEELSFYGLRSAAGMLGRSLVGVRMDRDGVVPDYLDVVCRRTGAKVLFCTPTLHNPTTATMPAERRREVADICARHDVLIVEDDVYGFLPDPPLRPLAAFAPDRVVHISSLSKLAGPGLRIGFMRVPQHLVDAFGIALRATTLMASPFNAEWAARLLASPQLDRMVAEMRAETQARQALVAAIMPGQAVMSDPNAYYFCLKLRNGWSAEGFARAAEAAGVGVTPLGLFEVSSLHQSDTVRVCVNAAPDRKRCDRRWKRSPPSPTPARRRTSGLGLRSERSRLPLPGVDAKPAGEGRRPADQSRPGGRRRCQSVAPWKAWPARTRAASPKCGPTSWKPTGAPASVKPPGRVRVGLPVMSNGQVKRRSPFISAASSPRVAIVASVGPAKAWAGTARRSMPSNRARTRPRKSSRRRMIFCTSRPVCARPSSISPDRAGPYSPCATDRSPRARPRSRSRRAETSR